MRRLSSHDGPQDTRSRPGRVSLGWTPSRGEFAGYTLVELAIVLGLAAGLAGMAAPRLLASLDDVRAAGAAQYVAGVLQRTRLEAISRGASVAVKFSRDGTVISYATYRDGNRNGVLTRDIQRGIDVGIRPPERLPAQCPHVDFGVLPGLPAVDPSSTPPGTDPLRIGSGDLITFTPLGTASAGSLYVLSDRGTQYVIRIYGDTGRTRVLKFDPRRRTWRGV